MKEKLEKFIIDNGLSFTVGRRNSDSTIISGYALHLGVKYYTEIVEAVESTLKGTADYREELEKTFDFALRNNYGKFWNTKAAKKEYKF